MLLQALAERDPELGVHLDDVADLAERRSPSASASRPTRSSRSATPPSCTTSARSRSPTRSSTSPARSTRTSGSSCAATRSIGERIIGAAPALTRVAALVRSSHERWDGGGYPDGLAGDEIPLGARIVAVCDAFDAMTSDRAYRRPMTPEEALAELRRCAGTQFDPVVVEAFAVVWRDRALAAAA